MALKIEVYSDVICPWCYLGKRRMEKALEILKVPPDGAHVCYLPFELDPVMPVDGLEPEKYYSNKGITPGETHRRLEILGREAGINFHFERIPRIPNTFNAHRLVWLAGKEGVQSRVVEAFFAAYFTHGKDLGNGEVLGETAVEAGLDLTKVQKLLKGAEGIWEVRELEKKANKLGIAGVPYYLINGKKIIYGAQPLETFVDIISQATASPGA